MDSDQLPDDLTDLERELAGRRAQPPVGLRPRVAVAVERELTRIGRLRRRLLVAGGIAAAVLVTAFIVWNRNVRISPPKPDGIDQSPVATRPIESDEALPTWRACRRAMEQSPGGLEELLDRSWAERTARSTRPPLTRADSETLGFNGDSQ